jgi:cobalamin biosynthesis protein CobD/CbiB
MSAMAGALNIELEKIGNYTLGENIRERSFDHVRRSIRIAAVASYLFVAATLPLLVVVSAFFQFW